VTSPGGVPTEYDPTSWETQEDPYPVHRWLRNEASVHHNERSGLFALSRFQDVWDATLDWNSLTSTHGQTLEKVTMPLPMMISINPPRHTRVRALVAEAFTPRRVGEMEPIVRQLTRERLADLEPGMQIDLFEQLASSVPMDVISTMLGVPPEHRESGELETNARHVELGAEFCNSAVTLWRHPDQRRLPVEDPGLLRAAVEELLRFDPPSQVQGRWSTRAVEIHGGTIPETESGGAKRS